MTATKEAVKRSQLVVDIEEVERSVTEIEHIERTFRKPLEPPRLAIAQINLADCYMRLLSWSQGWIDDTHTTYSNLVVLKDKLDAENWSALLTGNYALITTNFNSAFERFKKDFRTLDNKFTGRYHGAVEDDNRSSFWLFITYGLEVYLWVSR